MKVLKSGVEMTPEEMKESRGGACACGCPPGIGVSGTTNGAEHGSTCACICEPDDPQHDADVYIGPWKYIWIY